jgi:predicted restriction endonuclease
LKQIESGLFYSRNGTVDRGRLIKKYLIYKYGNKCMKCGWAEVNPTSGKIPIELEHIDGNSENNDLTNVLLLCPNCHSLTPTFRALNKGNGRHKRRERYHNGQSF